MSSNATSKSPSLVIITGPIGAGKSSVMRELVACSTTGNIAAIEGDVFWKFCAKGSMPRHESFKTVMRAMVSAAVAFAIGGNETFLDFTIPPWYFDAVRKIVSGRVQIDLVILKPSEPLCAKRSVSRTEGAINYDTESHCHELYEEFSAVASAHIVSDDTSDAKTIAEFIRKGLDEGKFRW